MISFSSVLFTLHSCQIVNWFCLGFCLIEDDTVCLLPSCRWTLSQHISVQLSFSQPSPVATLGSFCLRLAQRVVLSDWAGFKLYTCFAKFKIEGCCWKENSFKKLMEGFIRQVRSHLLVRVNERKSESVFSLLSVLMHKLKVQVLLQNHWMSCVVVSDAPSC